MVSGPPRDIKSGSPHFTWDMFADMVSGHFAMQGWYLSTEQFGALSMCHCQNRLALLCTSIQVAWLHVYIVRGGFRSKQLVFWWSMILQNDIGTEKVENFVKMTAFPCPLLYILPDIAIIFQCISLWHDNDITLAPWPLKPPAHRFFGQYLVQPNDKANIRKLYFGWTPLKKVKW